MEAEHCRVSRGATGEAGQSLAEVEMENDPTYSNVVKFT